MRADDILSDMVEPLALELRSIEENIMARDAELKELRATRDRVKRVVTLLDPERFPAKKPEPKSKGASKETIDSVRQFIRTTSGLGTFTGSQLKRDYEGLPSAGTLGAALTVLHENGELALVGSGQGGSKIYKVVR